MGKSVGRIAAGIATGGLSEAVPAGMQMLNGIMGGNVPKPADVGAPPTPPDEEAIARQAQIDEQKKNAVRSTPVMNEGGEGGILSNDSTYAKKQLLGI